MVMTWVLWKIVLKEGNVGGRVDRENINVSLKARIRGERDGMR